MVDIEILKERGCSAEAWQKLFEKVDPVKANRSSKKNPTTQEEKIEKIVNRIRSRTEAGRMKYIQDWRPYHALDLIWSAPQRQMSPSLIPALANLSKPEEAMKVLSAYGFNLDSVLADTTQIDPKSRKPIKKVVVPTFFSTIVPLARAYQEIRKAKLVNDRNRVPLIPFEPLIKTPKNRVKAHVVEQRMQVMSQQYNYLKTIDDAVHAMLLYRTALIFANEEWHYEEQLRYKKKGKGVEKFVVKEGIRWTVPHITRCYWDRSHPVKTLLTDTGCRWAGHWKVMTYGELKETPGFYNLDKISIGSSDWWTAATDYVNTYFNQCIIKSPMLVCPDDVKDREAWFASNSFYSTEQEDQAVVYVNHFEKVNPKRDGLGDYPYDIWARFVVAGDGTIIYAAPVPFTPCIPCQDNGDDKLTEDASLVQKLSSYQDQLTNLLTQYLLAVKQNLANVTFIDQNVLSKENVKELANKGEALFRDLNILPYDSKQLSNRGLSVEKSITQFKLGNMNTTEIIQAIRMVIDVAERVLQFSAQEVAQAATHEQTKREVELIGASSTNILQYTAMPVDLFLASFGHQLYAGWMNYGEDDFAVQIPYEEDITVGKLEEMGFTLAEEEYAIGKQVEVSGEKSAVELMTFAYIPSNFDRSNKLDVAREMAMFVNQLLANPMMQMAIGPQQAIMLANNIAKLAGLPLEAPLKFTGKTPEDQQKEAQAQLQEVVNKVLVDVKKGMVPVMKKLKEHDDMLAQLAQALTANAPPISPMVPGAVGPPPVMVPPTGGLPPEAAPMLPAA